MTAVSFGIRLLSSVLVSAEIAMLVSGLAMGTATCVRGRVGTEGVFVSVSGLCCSNCEVGVVKAGPWIEKE